MTQPPSFIDPCHADHVFGLKKDLYGLRQTSLAWFQRFNTSLLDLGFRPSKSDSSLIILHHGTTIYLLLYVDDIIITGDISAILH